MKPLNRIYVHFADYYHVQRARLNRASAADIRRNLSTAMRFCLLFADEVILPTSSVFESPECRQLIAEFPDFREHGVLKMSAGDASVEDHLESKVSAYNATSTGHFLRSYKKRSGLVLPSYIERKGSSTKAICAAWGKTIEDTEFVRGIRETSGVMLPSGFEKIWADVPEYLQGQAFVPLHAADALTQQGFAGKPLLHLIARPIECAYINGYVTELGAYVLTDIPYLSYNALEAQLALTLKLPYKLLLMRLQRAGLADSIFDASSSALFALWCNRDWELFADSVVSQEIFENVRWQEDLLSFLKSKTKPLYNYKTSPQLVLDMTQNSISDPTEKYPSGKRSFDTAIIVALPVELAAVQQFVDEVKTIRVESDPNSYNSATLQLPDGTKRSILLCMLIRMGNNSAATATTNLQRSFQVSNLVFCGIALGVPNPSDAGKHVRLGDVVVGDREGVVQIDHRSLSKNKDVNRSNLPPPPVGMVRALNELDAGLILERAPWNELIDRATKCAPRFCRPDSSTDVVYDKDGVSVLPHPVDQDRDLNHPKLIRGKIGSSNTLVKNGKYRDDMAHKFDLRAMEMESAGTLEALWNFGLSAMVVRGVCDYGVGKNDVWHYYAALAAAAVSVCLISKL